MNLRPASILALVSTLIALTACSSGGGSGTGGSGSAQSGNVDVGGYELFYQCEGEGNPTVVLDAGLGSAGTADFGDFISELDGVAARVCTYDRAGTGVSDVRPRSAGKLTAALEAEELHSLLVKAGIGPPYVLVPHSYGGLITRVYADKYPDEVAGFVFEDVSTAWEIDLWPKWDPSPWIDGGQKVDIQATEKEVLSAEPLGDRPSVVLSQDTYKGEGIPKWAAPIFAKQQAKLAKLGDDVVYARADGSGHFIHEERPELMVDAIGAVVAAVQSNSQLPDCEEVFTESDVTCLT
ncbi:MAG: alpha/beta hydrolase [Actinomycetota bacterium]